jgi:hypothetical protein
MAKGNAILSNCRLIKAAEQVFYCYLRLAGHSGLVSRLFLAVVAPTTFGCVLHLANTLAIAY